MTRLLEFIFLIPIRLIHYIWSYFAELIHINSFLQPFFRFIFCTISSLIEKICIFLIFIPIISKRNKFILWCTLFNCKNIKNDFISSLFCAENALKILKSYRCSYDKILEKEVLFYTIDNSYPPINEKNSYKSRYLYKDFAELVANKSILLLGSASGLTEKKLKLLISNHDFIFLHNSTKGSPILNLIPPHKLICCYRGEYGRELISSLIPENIYTIYKDPSTFERLKLVCRSRLLISFKLDTYLGSFNGVQASLIDLLHFNIKKITISGCNLLLTRKTFKGYRKASLGTVNYNSTFLRHPPIMQFLLLEKIRNYYPEKIFFDFELENIIGNGLKEYLTRMQTISKEEK